jgi:hypothetical protein
MSVHARQTLVRMPACELLALSSLLASRGDMKALEVWHRRAPMLLESAGAAVKMGLPCVLPIPIADRVLMAHTIRDMLGWPGWAQAMEAVPIDHAQCAIHEVHCGPIEALQTLATRLEPSPQAQA